MPVQHSLFDDGLQIHPPLCRDDFLKTLTTFKWNNRSTAVHHISAPGLGESVPVFTNEYWTSRQRAAHSLHEISYRACFKPQLPNFFLSLLSGVGDVVYDPFAGRGTTLLEAALQSRVPAGCDINPLSAVLVMPRLCPPTLREISTRLDELDLTWTGDLPAELLTFYHPETLGELCAMRAYLLSRNRAGVSDGVDDWIRMVTVNRLTGHSPGFLSVYTLPPNQAVSLVAQRKINRDRNQIPLRRDLKAILKKKTASLLQDVDDNTRSVLAKARQGARFMIGSCDAAFWEPQCVQLVVTSPPFLDVVNYSGDNWLRCWFCGIAPEQVPMRLFRRIEDWSTFMGAAFHQFFRLLKPGGFVAFEVGEVRAGSVRLEEAVLPAGWAAGLLPVCVLVNQQSFTKTANIWGVANNAKGTNTNRVVVFQKPD